MSKLTTDEKILKVTVDGEGFVWTLNGDGTPQATKKDTVEFLKSWMVDANETVRIVGTPINAKLTLDLFEMRLRGVFESLQVCSPMCCENAEERKDPAILLHSMRTYNRPPSLGGWHEFDLKDTPSYILAQHFRTQDSLTPEMQGVLRNHPAYDAVAFATELDEESLARLFGFLIDPRWYVDPNDPDRTSRYEQFLCLNPKSVAQANHQDATWRTNRCRLVQDCWKKRHNPQATEKSLYPRLFIWRVWLSQGGNFKGDLAASKHLAHFVRQAWAQAMYNGPLSDRLFVPKYFFFCEDEHKAYEDYLAQLKLKRSNTDG